MPRMFAKTRNRPSLSFEDLIDDSYLGPPAEAAAATVALLPKNLVGLWESKSLQPSQIDTYVPLGI